MKAKRVWIATHKDEPENREVSFTEPLESTVTIYSDYESGDTDWAEYKEYLLIELET